MTPQDFSPFVQHVNVLRLIADHTPDELAAVSAKIDEVIEHLDGLRSYRDMLTKVAETAGVVLTKGA